jgi:hypothetical protein
MDRMRMTRSEKNLNCRLGAKAKRHRLSLEVLEARQMLAADNGLPSVFPDALGYKDPVIREAILNVSTTNSDAPMFPVDGGSSGGISTNTRESAGVIGLDRFRADPRFSAIDGSGFAAVVLDTGIDLNHPFFGPDADGNGIADRIVYQQDFANGDNDATDFNDHGSNVTSIVASSDATYTGMAPGADIIHLKVFTDAGGGNFGYLESALQWTIANASTYNIASVNMSLGDSGNHALPQSLYGLGDELAALRALDVMVVSSQGNSFFEYNSAQGAGYPAADPNSISVGAVYDSDVGRDNYGGPVANTTGPGRITPFSQRSGVITDIFAPGAYITGANQSGGTVAMPGTSQASPHIAGIAVLAQELANRVIGRRLTQTEFTAFLRITGTMINDGDDEDDNVTNTGLNFPMVDVLKLGEAILALGGSPTAVADGPDILVRSTQDQTITVTYQDGVGIDVSDLGTGDIEVIGPNGYSEIATFVSVNNETDGTPRIATYTIPAPGGVWNASANGNYLIQMVANQVSDTDDELIPAGNIGAFLVDMPIDLGPDGFGYTASAAAYEFTDISATGRLVLEGADDLHREISPGNGFSFDFYGETYDSLYVSSNGLITFGGFNSDYDNTNLSSRPDQPTIAAFWDDLDAESGQGVYWQLLGEGDNQQLVLQWETGFFSASGLISFQAVLSEADNSIQINYRDLSGNSSTRDEGHSATVGIKNAGDQGADLLVAHHNNTSLGFVGTSRSLVIQKWNRPPETLTLSTTSIAENVAAGSTVGLLVTSDPDINETFTYELVSGDGDWDNRNFEIVGNELRIISSPDFERQVAHLIRVRTTDSDGNQLEQPMMITVVDRPELEAVVVAAGDSQRSRVDQLVVTFDGEVTLDPTAFNVVRRGDQGGEVETVVTTTVDSQGRTVASIAFAGPLTRGGALIDGNFQLVVDASKVIRGGQALDGQRDGSSGTNATFGDDSADNFYALFGDVDGDRSSAIADFALFRAAYGKSEGEEGFDPRFDFDDDGFTGVEDFSQFRSRFGATLDFE